MGNKNRRRIPPTGARASLLSSIPKPVIEDLPWDPDNPLEVNSCSKNNAEHSKDCDGSCGKEQMQEIDVLIENERRAWARLSMDQMNYSGNQLRLSAQVVTIISLLKKRFDVTDDEFNEEFKPNFLELMRIARQGYEEFLRSKTTQSRLVVPDRPLL